jgi:hypothetical protein
LPRHRLALFDNVCGDILMLQKADVFIVSITLMADGPVQEYTHCASVAVIMVILSFIRASLVI